MCLNSSFCNLETIFIDINVAENQRDKLPAVTKNTELSWEVEIMKIY